MNKEEIDIKPFVMECLKQKLTLGNNTNLEEFLRNKGVADQLIPGILAKTIKIEQSRKVAKSRILEGGVITTIGLGGMAYETVKERNGVAWLLWSMVGLGILANGLWKRKKIKQYN
jgi:hypothetical protein